MQIMHLLNDKGKKTGTSLPYFTEFFPFSNTMNVALLQWQLDRIVNGFKIKPVDWLEIHGHQKNIPMSFNMLISVTVGFSIAATMNEPDRFEDQLGQVLKNQALTWLGTLALIRLYYGNHPVERIRERIEDLKDRGHDTTFMTQCLEAVLTTERSSLFDLEILAPKVQIDMKPISPDLDIVELQINYHFLNKQFLKLEDWIRNHLDMKREGHFNHGDIVIFKSKDQDFYLKVQLAPEKMPKHISSRKILATRFEPMTEGKVDMSFIMQ